MKAIFLLLLCFTTLVNGQTVGDLFKSMPSELLPGVSEGNKTMLLVDTGQASVPYALGEIKKMAHSDDHLIIQTSNIGTTELKLLPVNHPSTIINLTEGSATPDSEMQNPVTEISASQYSMILCLIRTVCAHACDSRIDFYTTGWEKIDNPALLPPINEEIFFDSSKKELDNYKYAVSLPGIYPISAKFSDNGTDLLLTFNFREHLDDRQVNEVAPFLKSDTITFKWNGVSFK